MVLTVRRIGAALIGVLLAASIAACKPPPPHTDSTRGDTRQERSGTGMHDNHPM